VRRDGVLEVFGGVLVHDHDKKFYKYGALHATCGAHLSRELKGLYEFYGVGWAGKFRRFFVGLNRYKECDKEKGVTCCVVAQLLLFEDEYDALLVEGESVLEGLHCRGLAFKELRRLLRRLRVYKSSYLLFLRDYRVSFTNNLAERDLRHCKTRQKVSGCFRSWRGLECYARIRSFLSTESKRGHQLLPVIKTLFTKTL
jgi:transposase